GRCERSRAGAPPAVEPRQAPPAGCVEEGGEQGRPRQDEENGLRAPHMTFTTPRPERASLRTRTSTSPAASSGTMLAVIRIGLNEKRSATTPMRNVDTIVPAPAAAHAPAAADEEAREPAPEEVAEVGGQERDPEAGGGVFDREALAREVDREPVGDHEPHGVAQAAAGDDAPGLGKREQRAPARP